MSGKYFMMIINVREIFYLNYIVHFFQNAYFIKFSMKLSRRITSTI